MVWFLSPQLTSGVLATVGSVGSLSMALQISSCPRLKPALSLFPQDWSPSHGELVPADCCCPSAEATGQPLLSPGTLVCPSVSCSTATWSPKLFWGGAAAALSEGPSSHPWHTHTHTDVIVAHLQSYSWGGRDRRAPEAC